MRSNRSTSTGGVSASPGGAGNGRATVPWERPPSEVREIRLSQLRPWAGNPRHIADEDRFDELKQVLVAERNMLWARPLLALPDGTVFGGNHRLLAAIELGWETIPVLTLDIPWERARVWALLDNNQFAEWNEPALAALLAELEVDGIELALTGFSGGELDRILAGITPPADPDTAPPLPTEEPDSRAGEIYELGPHRLACGDARDRGLLERLLEGQRPEVLWTDPPYGIGYVGKTPAALTITNDDADAGSLLTAALAAVDPLLAPSARFYIAAPAGQQGTAFRLALAEVGLRHHETLVWVKNSIVLGHSDYHLAHEDVLYGYRPGPGRPGRGRHQGSRWYGDNAASSVFHVDRPSASTVHPTMKPTALIGPMLQNSSRRGDPVIDLFAGSGSTLLACEQLGRRCFAVELDPRYCDVIRRRFAEYTDGR